MSYELARTIRKRRNELNMSQNELSRRSGVDRSTISQIESGKRRKPNIDTLLCIAVGLDLDGQILLEQANYLKKNINNDDYQIVQRNNREVQANAINYKITITGTCIMPMKDRDEALACTKLKVIDDFYSVKGKSKDFDSMMKNSRIRLKVNYFDEL